MINAARRHKKGYQLYYMYQGQHMTLDHLLGIAHHDFHNQSLQRHTLDRRLRRGWPVKDALKTPLGQSRPSRPKIKRKKRTKKMPTSEQIAAAKRQRRQQARQYRQANRTEILRTTYRSRLRIWLQRYATKDKLEELKQLIEDELIKRQK